MTKTKDNLVPTTPIEALPEGVGAGGSDYMDVSTKFPGARLKDYWKVWESLNAHPRVVLVLKQDYCLPFKQKPPLTHFPAVVPVQNKNSLRFYSRLFLVPKPENNWHPVW